MPSPTRSLFGWWSNLERSPRDIERDIDDEIACHLDCAARELEAQGSSADEARAAARERFGDIAAIAAACRKTQLGARIMLQRIQLVLLVALVLAVGAMAWRSQAAQAAARVEVLVLRTEMARLYSVMGRNGAGTVRAAERPSIDEASASWLAAFQTVTDWRDAARIADDLSRLAPSDTTAIVYTIFDDVKSVTARQQILKAFSIRGGRSNALAVLNLGMYDSDPRVREWAIDYLQNYAWRKFASDADAVWWSTDKANVRIETVLEGSVNSFFAAVGTHTASEVDADLDLLLSIDPLVLNEHGSERTVRGARDAIVDWTTKHATEWNSRTLERACAAAQRIGVDVARLPAEVRAFEHKAESPR